MLRYRLKSKSVPVIEGVTVERKSGFTGLWGAHFYDVPCVCDDFNPGSRHPHYHVTGPVRAYPEFVMQPRQCDAIDVHRIDGRL